MLSADQIQVGQCKVIPTIIALPNIEVHTTAASNKTKGNRSKSTAHNTCKTLKTLLVGVHTSYSALITVISRANQTNPCTHD